jgi:hypothetical protein
MTPPDSPHAVDWDARYRQEPRFRDFVDYLVTVIRAAAFTGGEVVGAATLAACLAEEARLKIPQSAVPTVSGSLATGSK